MDEPPRGASPSPPNQRAEEILSRAGEWLGSLVLGTLRSVERAATGSPAEPSSAEAPPADSAATARAERMLDGAGERVGHFAALAGQRLRMAAALAREEAEDLWAEAQHLRNQRR